MRGRRILCYTLAGILFAGYLVLFLTGSDTKNVSSPYRRFYLDEAVDYYSDLQVTEETLAGYTAGTRFSYRLPDAGFLNQGKGWRYPDEEGTWAIGPCSEMIFFVAHPQRAHVLILECDEILTSGLSLYAGDICADLYEASEEPAADTPDHPGGTLQFEIPAGTLTEGLNLLQIRSETAKLYGSIHVTSVLLKEDE